MYDALTDEIIASGPAPQCARVLGMTPKVFYSTVSHALAGINRKYAFCKESVKKEDLSE